MPMGHQGNVVFISLANISAFKEIHVNDEITNNKENTLEPFLPNALLDKKAVDSPVS